MPCRSSLASICFRPRDNCARSRRASGASGGGSVGKILAGGDRELEAAGFDVAGGFTVWEWACCFGIRDFFRSGLICLATLSQSARSSSLKLRLRRAGGVPSVVIEGLFIGIGDGATGDKDAPRESRSNSAEVPAMAPRQKPMSSKLSQLTPAWPSAVSRSLPRWLVFLRSAGRLAET